MGLNSSGPISLGGTTAGQSIAVELGGTGTAQISLNCTSVRTLAGVPSGAIIMPTNFYGKSNAFAYTVSANQTNFCMRAGAVTAGWNGTSKLNVTINSGVIISSNSTGTPAMRIQGAYAGGVSVINSGTIVGMGGNGGGGGCGNCGGGGPGNGAGTALKICSTVTICNNAGVIAGGGGGGGGGGGASGCCGPAGGGGGGGGRSSNAANSSGGGGGASPGNPYNPGASGGSGTYAGAGGGGRGAYGFAPGGSGGNWGSNGGGGSSGFGGGGSGGAGGKATCGTSFVTWTTTGTRYGSVS